jgi:Protein of unknown function (DUF3489)
MPKLTDTQLVILAGAAQREDGSILPLPKKLKLGAKAIEGVLSDLVKNKLVAEEPAADRAPSWRETTDGQPMTLKITASGLRAIGAQEPKGGEAKNPPPRPARKPQARKSSSRTPPARKGQVRRSSKDTRPRPGSSRAVRGGSKQAKLIELLRRPQGASLSEMQKATGWQAHSVRGVMSGALKKKLGLSISSRKDESGERRYRITK